MIAACITTKDGRGLAAEWGAGEWEPEKAKEVRQNDGGRMIQTQSRLLLSFCRQSFCPSVPSSPEDYEPWDRRTASTKVPPERMPNREIREKTRKKTRRLGQDKQDGQDKMGLVWLEAGFSDSHPVNLVNPVETLFCLFRVIFVRRTADFADPSWPPPVSPRGFLLTSPPAGVSSEAKGAAGHCLLPCESFAAPQAT